MVTLVKSTRELSFTSAPRPPSKVRFWIPIRCDALMESRWPLTFPGTTVADGFPKMVKSVRPNITTFSWQVPVTEIELGPAAGSEASAAVIEVKAPGVAPEQSTTAPSAKARWEKSSSKQAKSNLHPEEQSFIVILVSLIDFEILLERSTVSQQNACYQQIVSFTAKTNQTRRSFL